MGTVLTDFSKCGTVEQGLVAVLPGLGGLKKEEARAQLRQEVEIDES